MKTTTRMIVASLCWGLSLFSSLQAAALHLPYAQAGLSRQQAAQLLLDRFSYGARPGEVKQVIAQGLDQWFEQQLTAATPETELESRLAQFPALGMTHQQLFARFPGSSLGTAHARRFYDLIPPADKEVDLEWSTRKLAQFRKEQGYLSQETDLYQQLTGQKLMRTIFARNQLNEVMTEFWFNQLYVTSSNFRSRPWILAYESEVIRPNALGPFSTLLSASVMHPAFVQATAGDARKATITPAQSTMGLAFTRMEAQGQKATIETIQQQLDQIAMEEDLLLQKRFWPETGPNTEFARLVLGRTLGNDGYRERDLEDTARIFTGWSTLPYGATDQWFKGGFAVASSAGFVQQGSFVFRANRHDALPKQVLGRQFAAGGGYEEGQALLQMLATQPATARHIATALTKQFTGTESPRLIDELARSFRQSHGDMRSVMRTLAGSVEFWRQAATHELPKSPLRYASSAIRSLQADITDTAALTQWLTEMGQPLYAYTDSQGEPIDAAWLEGGKLMSRLRFATALGNGQIKGITLPTHDERLAMQIASPAFQLH